MRAVTGNKEYNNDGLNANLFIGSRYIFPPSLAAHTAFFFYIRAGNRVWSSEQYGLVITQNSHAEEISVCEPLLISTLLCWLTSDVHVL